MCHLKNVRARMKIKKKHDRIPVPIGLYPNQQLHGVCIIIHHNTAACHTWGDYVPEQHYSWQDQGLVVTGIVTDPHLSLMHSVLCS
jgi:hypothetical protein